MLNLGCGVWELAVGVDCCNCCVKLELVLDKLAWEYDPLL